MDAMKQHDHNQEEDQPKIYGVFIDEKNQVKISRRKFIRSAVIVGTTVTLSGCVFPDSIIPESVSEEDLVAALDLTLQARDTIEAEQNSTPTEQPSPTNTSTPEPTGTPTQTPTNTEVPYPIGEVTTSHNIFKGPHVDHPVDAQTVIGEEVKVIGKTEDGVWFKITDSEGNTGWVFAEFIELREDVEIPEIRNIPTRVPTICECDVYTPCTCDNYSEPAPCSCDAVHYWYPD